jgi:hypothetical protein
LWEKRDMLNREGRRIARTKSQREVKKEDRKEV